LTGINTAPRSGERRLAARFDPGQTRPHALHDHGRMDVPLQVSFHGVRHSDALYTDIRERARKLERYYDHITSCRVVLELAARHKRKGKQYCARIDLRMPGGEIAVTHEHDEDLQIALREAFEAARRQLEDYARTQRGDVKHHSGG
jgi:ribosomal subunit interface protein